MDALFPRINLDFPVRSGDSPLQYFDPVAVEERGVMIVGGPKALSVFFMGDRPRFWYSVNAREWISGFTAKSDLYVQDGPVLSGWHLNEQRCFAAVNLITEKHWMPDDNPESGKAGPPADLYDLTGEAARLQEGLLRARQHHAASDTPHNLLAIERLALADQPGAERVVFSAPVVRQFQFEANSNRVFSLSMDGAIVALNEDLEMADRLIPEVGPVRAELAMAEIQQPGGRAACYLYYAAKDGGIVALEGMGRLARRPNRWAGKSTPEADKVLPLRVRDGLLFGGGILGADFFVLELDPERPPRLTMPGPPGGWKRYAVDTNDKLAIITNGIVSRLVSYEDGARQRDRWQERRAPAACDPVFWAGTGKSDSLVTAKLLLEVDEKRPMPKDSGLPFRVLLANTIGSEDPSLTSPLPPEATPLTSGTFATPAGTIPSVDRALLGEPFIYQHTMYCTMCVVDLAVGWKYKVLGYAIAPVATSVAAAAAAQIERNRQYSKAIVLQIKATYEEGHTGGDKTRNGPNPFANQEVPLLMQFVDQRVEPRKVQTDGQGQLRFDSSLFGVVVWVDPHFKASQWMKDHPWSGDVYDITSATLDSSKLNQIHFTWYEYHGKA